MKKIITIILLLLFVACSQRDKGHIIEVLHGEGYEEVIDKNEVRFISESIALPFTVARLELGHIDAFITNEHTAKYYVKSNDSLDLLGRSINKEQMSLGLRSDNRELHREVNRIISEMLADGSLDFIANKYLSDDYQRVEVEDKKDLEPREKLDKKSLKVAIVSSYPPFSFYEGKELKGLDIELIDEIANRLGVNLEVSTTDRIGMEKRLIQGQYDIIMGNIIPKDMEGIIYTIPYLNSGAQIVIKAGEKINI